MPVNQVPDDPIPSSVSRVIRRIGYDIVRATGEFAPLLPGFRHGPVLPVKATYSPWLSADSFQETLNEVSGHTLVDIYRCYELWSLVTQSAKLAAGAVIEIGVWRGGTGCLIARAAKLANICEPIYLCDTFEGVVKAGVMDTVYCGGEHKDTSQELVAELGRKMGLTSIRILKGILPDESAHLITEQTFRFAHIDVDVYQSAKEAVKWLWPRMVTGGLIVFDDYGTYGCEGVTRFVNELIGDQDKLFLHNLNGQAILVKK